jgi:proliferating cell nuclear antigen
MRLLLENGVVFKKTIAVVSELMESTCFKFTPKGLEFSGMDSSHVSMTTVTMHNTMFCEYDLPEGNVSVGIGLKSLNSILRLIGDKDQLQISYDPSKDNVINVQFANMQKKRNYDFDLKLMDIDNDELEVPELAFSHGLDMVSVDFAQVINDCVVFGDTVKLAVGYDKMVTSVDGEHANSFMSLDGQAVLPNEGQPVTMKFALRYLQFFAKGKDVCKTVSLRLFDGLPICVSYNIGPFSELTFYLAPKVEEEDEQMA